MKNRDLALGRDVLLPLLLFLTALATRLVSVGRYITPDELIWVYRSVQFREALLDGRWAETLVAGHPGITTTWLGSFGMSVQMLISAEARDAYTWITQLAYLTPDNMTALQELASLLSAGRIAVILTNALAVVVAYLLAKRLFGNPVALLFGAVLALDPFVAGLGGLLHVDGLMTSFATVALLALMLMLREKRLRWAALTGVATGLALLSKTPAVLLLPFGGLVLLLCGWQLRAVKPFLTLSVTWGISAVITVLLLFPALWAAPSAVVQFTSSNTNRHVEEALRPTFFMGEVAFDHGPIFYPVALAWRLSPIVFAGLIVLVWMVWKRTDLRRDPNVWLALMWAGLFVAGISVAAKKFDRYMLPAMPLLALVAALAWGGWAQSRRWLVGVLLAVLAGYALAFGGYPLAAYNPLVGGPWTAQAVMPLGWGEGISASGRWLSVDDATSAETALSGIAPSLAPFFHGNTLPAESGDLTQADYLIVTANSYQTSPQATAEIVAPLTLRQTIRYGFLDQAWVYENDSAEMPTVDWQPFEPTVNFGGRVDALAQAVVGRDRQVDVHLRWQLAQPDGRYFVRLRLRDAAGEVWSELETELVNEVAFYPEHWQAGETPEVVYALSLPLAMPPDTYEVELSLVDAISAELLPIQFGDGTQGGTRLLLDAVTLTLPETVGDAAALPIDHIRSASWMGDALELLGHGDIQPEVETGGRVPLTLFWRANSPLTTSMQVALALGDTEIWRGPLSRLDTFNWREGELIEERLSLAVPTDFAPGRYPLTLSVLTPTDEALRDAVVLGEIDVQASDRLFALPSSPEMPLNLAFGNDGSMRLLGADGDWQEWQPGEAGELVLYWQTSAEQPDLLSVFVHLQNSDGVNVAQSDQWPGGSPSVTWAEGQVIVDGHTLTLPPNLPAGEYDLLVGLYSAETGVRLPLLDAPAGSDSYRLGTLQLGASDE